MPTGLRRPARARRRSRVLDVVLGGGALVALAWIPLRFVGAADWRPAFALLSLTPAVPVVAVVVAVVSGVTRRWWTAGAATVAAVVLAGLVVPRALPDTTATDPTATDSTAGARSSPPSTSGSGVPTPPPWSPWSVRAGSRCSLSRN